MPKSFLNFPATQAVQGPPSGPVVPWAHIVEHAELLVLASGEDGRSAGQGVHDASVVCPVASPYLPAPQGVHDASVVCPVATPYLPAPQAVHDVCPVSTPYLPTPHTVHDASADPPVSARYLPAPHTVHGADPVKTLYFPVTHPVQLKSGPDEPALQVQLLKAALPASVHGS